MAARRRAGPPPHRDRVRGMSAVWATVVRARSDAVLLQVWLIPGVLVGYISAVRALAQHALTDGRRPLLASRSSEAIRSCRSCC